MRIMITGKPRGRPKKINTMETEKVPVEEIPEPTPEPVDEALKEELPVEQPVDVPTSELELPKPPVVEEGNGRNNGR